MFKVETTVKSQDVIKKIRSTTFNNIKTKKTE